MAEWHPRGNVFPVSWVCRNGRYSQPYAIIHQFEPTPGGRERKYEVYEYSYGGQGPLLDTFDTGDEAAVFAWEWHLSEGVKHHEVAARSPGVPIEALHREQ